MTKHRWTSGIMGLGLSAAVAVPAMGRSHYTGQVPPSIAPADPLAATTMVTPPHAIHTVSHKTTAAAAAKHKHKKHHKRKRAGKKSA